MTIDPWQIATQLVRERYNVPATIKQLTRLHAFVLRLRFTDRPPRILKLSKSGDPSSLRKELAVIDALRQAGIPSAEVEFADLAAPLPYVIFLSAGETTVMDALADADANSTLVTNMGSLLARIHGVQAGALAGTSALLANNPGTTAGELHQLADAIAAAGILTQQEVLSFKALAMPGIPGGSLCHGDFHTVHCVLDEGRITAVVDWETAWIGNSLIDLAVAASYFDYYAPTFALPFLEGYSRVRPIPSDFADMYLPVRMAHALGLIRVFNMQKREPNVARAVELFRSYQR